MFRFRRLAAVGLSLAMVLTGGMVAFANEGEEAEVVPISAPIEEQDYEYIRFDGVVEEIDETQDSYRILVKKDTEEGLDALLSLIHI